MNDQFLEHYGVLGMKWGIRRSRAELGYKPVRSNKAKKEKTERREEKEIIRDRKTAVKNRRKLSDEELNARISRLEKEKKLRDLTEDDTSRGKKKVKEIFSSTAGKVLKSTAYAGTAAGVVAVAKSPAFKKFVKKIPYSSEVKNYITKNLGVSMKWEDFINQYLIPAVKPKKK